jgi:hypothetical protein
LSATSASRPTKTNTSHGCDLAHDAMQLLGTAWTARTRPWCLSSVPPCLYDWNLLPIGQKLAPDHLETYERSPPLQVPTSYNLSQVMEEIHARADAFDASGGLWRLAQRA